MKLYSLGFLLWGTILVNAIPDDYEQTLQTRSFGDLPGVNWFYGDESNFSKPEEITNEVKNEDESHQVIPLEKAEVNDKPEPIEIFFKELQEQANKGSMNAETPFKDDENLTNVLKELNKTVANTPNELVKVLVNNTWRIFNIGALGSSRRTRTVNETSYFVSIPDILQLLKQFLGFSSSTTDNTQQENIGSQTPQSKPSAQQNVPKGHIAIPSQMLKTQESLNNQAFKLVVNKENKEKANDVFDSQVPDEIFKKMREYLEKPDSTTEDKFYIVLKLDDMFDHLHEIKDDESALDVLYSIIDVADSRKFTEIFNTLKSSKNRDDRDLWHFFQNSRRTLTSRIRSIHRIIRQKKVEKEPLPDNCFITHPIGEKVGNSMVYNQWNPESDDDFYKFCFDDKTVDEATKTIMTSDTDSMHVKLFRITSHSDSLALTSPMHKWYTIVKLYNMYQSLKAEEEKEKSKPAQEGEEPKSQKEDDKKELVESMTQIGENGRYERIFESLKAADKPVLKEIWTAFKDNGKKPENNPYQRWGSGRFPWTWSKSRTWSNRY